jgi:carbonic anhydrase
MKYLPRLFENNREWAERMKAADREYFQRLCEIQRPDYLWIGCSDSRVPANQIVGLAPGELFVHRNVANIVVADDANVMAVIQFAVEALSVRHIIVCGHYGCGGVKAALEGAGDGFVREWLSPLRRFVETQDPVPDWQTLCELNVKLQIDVLRNTDPVRGAWTAGRELYLHGWIYSLGDGLLRDLDVSVAGA